MPLSGMMNSCNTCFTCLKLYKVFSSRFKSRDSKAKLKKSTDTLGCLASEWVQNHSRLPVPAEDDEDEVCAFSLARAPNKFVGLIKPFCARQLRHFSYRKNT